MKIYGNSSLIAAALALSPWLLQAQTGSSTTTDTSAASDGMTTESHQETTTEHWGHEYNDGGWRRNLTVSLGVDAVRSNAKFSGGSNSVSLSADPKWGFGGMAAIELGLADYAGIAVGAHYLQRRFQVSGNGVDFTRSIGTLLVPVEARFYFARVISLGAGAFAAFPVGKTHDSFSSGDTTVVETGSSRSGIDYGLTGALGVNIPLGPLGIFGEARYNWGLSDSASNSDVEERMRDILLTAGIKLKI